MEANSSIYDEAVSLLMERFPTLGLLAGTWTIEEPSEEALPRIEIGQAEALYFYGLGAGSIYFACKSWLKANSKRQLILLENVPGFIAWFLHRPEALEILSDPQVHLELFSNTERQIEALAERFPVKRIEVSGFKSKKGLNQIRLKLLRKTALSHALHQDRVYGDQPFYNFAANLRHLPSSFYANGLKGAFEGVPAIVCGAGPSLQHSMEELRRLEDRALLIAGGSTLAALTSRGIRPHFGMAVDPNLEEYRRMKNSFAFEIPLLYSTRVHPGIFQTCNGPFGYMRAGIGGVPELWIEEELGLSDELMGRFLPEETISVTSICIAWAQFLGCNPILIHGVDLAYTGGRRYAAGVASDENVDLDAIDSEKSAADRIVNKKDRNGKRVSTAVRWLMESASISKFAKSHPDIQFINTTEEGIGFKGIEFAPLSEAASLFPKRSIRHRVQECLRQHPMPSSAEQIICEKMGELKSSLGRLIECLAVLAGEKKGSKPLAEVELKDEISYLYLFYDIERIFKQGPDFWSSWLDLARRYERAFCGFDGKLP